MSIHLHIEQLILDGLSVRHGDTALLQSAMEAELVRLFRANGLPGGWSQAGNGGHIEAPLLSLSAAADSKAIGTELGGRVYLAMAGRQGGDHG